MSKFIKRIVFNDIHVKDIETENEIVYGEHGVTVYLSKEKDIFIPYYSIELIETTLQS